MPTTPWPLLAALIVALGPALGGGPAAPDVHPPRAARPVIARHVVWQPSDEDRGADTGPDPGTCEALHSCGSTTATLPK